MCILHIEHYTECACDIVGEWLEPCALKQRPSSTQPHHFITTTYPISVPSSTSGCTTTHLIQRLIQECPHCVWLAELEEEIEPLVVEKGAEEVEMGMGGLSLGEGEGGEEEVGKEGKEEEEGLGEGAGGGIRGREETGEGEVGEGNKGWEGVGGGKWDREERGEEEVVDGMEGLSINEGY